MFAYAYNNAHKKISFMFFISDYTYLKLVRISLSKFYILPFYVNSLIIAIIVM